MAPVSNRFAKYVVQQDEAGGGRASKPNRFAKYKAVEAPAAPQTNPMEAQGQAAQQEWRDAGSKPTNPNPENPIVTAQRGSQTQAMSHWAQQGEAERQAEAARAKSRREAAAAFGGGMDMLPTEDAGGNVRPGTAIDTNISKGVISAPFQALEAVKDTGVSMANLAGETYNTVNNALTAPLGVKPLQVPKITTPDNPLIAPGGALQSTTGDIERNLMQLLIARKIVGNTAPGGGTAAQLGKDAIALGAGFDADTGRLSETVNEFVQKSGSPQIAKDYIGWLAQRDPNNPLLERFKNMVEDFTISGPLVAPQAAIRGGQAIGNALAPVARTPTNAGGTAARSAVADPYLVREASPAPAPGAAGAAPAAPQKSMFSSTGQYSVSTQDSGAFDVNLNRMNDGGAVIMHDKGTIPIAPEFAKGKSDEELLAYYFEPLGFQGATKAASAVQPPITAFPVTSPRPPTTRSQAAGAGAPPPPAQPPAVVAQPGAGAPPPGTLTPVPTANAATAEFNALPRKVRESVFRAMRNSGFDNNGVIAAIRDLNTLPPDRQSMFATELVRKYGAQFPELEANLAAMGRKFAVDTPKPRQIFGRTIERDGARQLMNDEVRSQIDSEADYLNGTVERLFGPGAVPAKEELLRLQQAGGAEYRRLLSTTNRYGRARAPAKRAEIDRNVATLANYLKRPEVMNNVPDWVKQKVMLEVSNDLRQLKFTPDEQALIVAGDPGLAALFTPDAPLAYSPQLWKTLVDLYPTQSAHSLQSAYAKAIREARFSPDPQTRVWVDTLSRARGKSTVRANARNTDDRGFGLLKMLEDAVPGYKEARMKYGNVMGAQEALDDARQFMSIAGDETKLAQFVDDFEDLSDLQRTAVENQVSSIIRQSIANKVDNPKLAELGREGPSTPNLTAISKQPFLDALPQVFGPKGQEMADAIRMARSNTDYLTGLHPKYNSRTGVNEADVKNADRIYEDPAGAESTVLDNAVTQGLGGAGLGAAFIPGAAGAAIPLIGLAAAKALWTARKAGKRLSPSEKTQLAEFLFRSRRQGGNAAEGGTPPGGPPQLPGPRGPSPLDTGGNMAAGAAIGAAVGGAASNGDPNAMLAGAAVGATGGALRARARNSSSLIPVSKPKNALAVAGGSTPSPANALSTPPRPPVKAGFGGSSKPLPMDEASRMQRAREQGFDVDTPLYHGTPDSRGLWEDGQFKTAKEKYLQQDDPERVYFFAEDPKVARTYADPKRAWDYQNATPENVSVYLRMSNPKTIDWGGRPFRGREKDATGYSIREQIDAARAQGHDGVIIKNVIDTYDGKGKPSTIRAVFDPSNIRSTKAAFDPSQSGSSKLLAGMGASPEAAGAIGGGAAGYALAPDQNGDGVVDAQERAAGGLGGFVSGIAGAKIVRGAGNALRNTTPPKGPPSGPAQQTFGGVKAKTADLKLQRIAQDMEKAGASRDQIWKETGWFKGNDGKWRFEIDDSKAQFKGPRDSNFPENVASSIYQPKNQVLRDVLDDADAGGAYPKIAKDTRVRLYRGQGQGAYIPEGRYSDAIIETQADAGDPTRSVLLHERQHAIQGKEDFAMGGAPGVGMIDDVEAIGNVYNNTGRPWNELDGNMQDNILRNAAMDRYRRLAGEVEARNVQTRRDFTPEERRARPPWTTQDVPDEQQIVRYGSGHANSEPTPRQSITLAETKDANGKPVTVKGEAFNDRGRMVLSPEWPTNAFDELEKARQKAAMDSAFPPKPGPKLVDENYGKPPKPRSEWEVENPKAAEEIGRKVAERFVGLMNADPSPVHVLALKEGVDIQSIGNIIEGGLPKNRQIWIAKDGGEIAVVDKAWHRQNPQEYTTERWNRMWPSSVTREGRRYGWQEGRPFIFADEAPNPPPAQAGFSFGGGKGPPQPQANALASPPKKPRPVEARREAPRGNKPFNNPSLSQGENKISEMLLNGYEYPAIADEMMTSVDVVKQLAKRAQDKLGDAVKLPRPGMGKRPVGSTKREAAFGLFDEGLDNATIAQRTGLSLGNVRTYRSYWKQGSGAPVANVNGASYNPPAMPERPFEADYPQKDWPDGVPTDAQGRLVLDMEGRPLDQNSVVVGRTKAPGVGPKSEADQTLRDRIAVIQTLKQAGSSLERVPRSADQTSGSWSPNFDANGRFTGRGSARITDDLDRPIAGLDDQEVITLSHELAHSIDFRAKPARNVGGFNKREWGIDHRNPDKMPPASASKIESQLQRVYRDLNNPIDGEVKIRTPRDHGYDAVDADRELWAEAIRAYMWDPNYIKTVAPDVAFMIRHHVNRNSSLRKTIQFNAIPTIVGVGGLGLGAAALNGQPAEAKTRSSGMRANALAPAQNNRP